MFKRIMSLLLVGSMMIILSACQNVGDELVGDWKFEYEYVKPGSCFDEFINSAGQNVLLSIDKEEYRITLKAAGHNDNTLKTDYLLKSSAGTFFQPQYSTDPDLVISYVLSEDKKNLMLSGNQITAILVRVE